jgi:carboxymethylenebutenolidase
MKRIVLWAALILLPAIARAVTEEVVDFPSGSEMVKATLFLPKGRGAHPGIVVVHEWWGVNDWVKERSRKLADQGYVALAVDLYRGQLAKDPGTAHELARGLPRDRALRDLLAAVAYLKTRLEVSPTKLGAIGWCMGGGYAENLAEAQPDLKAVAIHYGAIPSDASTISQLQPAILGIFGGQDKGISPDSVRAFEKEMKKQGKTIEVRIYPSAGHAFENPGNKDGYRAGDAKDAWNRTLGFFDKRLKKG